MQVRKEAEVTASRVREQKARTFMLTICLTAGECNVEERPQGTTE